MRCLGKNHSFNCNCGFGSKSESSRAGEFFSAIATVPKNSNCPRCGASVFYRPGPIGGGTYFDRIGEGWHRHPCTDSRYRYSPWNRKNIPKLRNRLSRDQRRGYCAIVLNGVFASSETTIIRGSWLENPSTFEITMNGSHDIDARKSIFIRKKSKQRVSVDFCVVGDLVSKRVNAELRAADS